MNSWIDLAKEMEEQTPGLVYYELPTIQSRNPLYQMFINEGMRAGIPNQTTRQRTVTLYLDKPAFLAALELSDEEHIYVLLVDRQGNVLFRTRGPYNPQESARLHHTVQGLTHPASANAAKNLPSDNFSLILR
jgi:hypothetical protein